MRPTDNKLDMSNEARREFEVGQTCINLVKDAEPDDRKFLRFWLWTGVNVEKLSMDAKLLIFGPLSEPPASLGQDWILHRQLSISRFL